MITLHRLAFVALSCLALTACGTGDDATTTATTASPADVATAVAAAAEASIATHPLCELASFDEVSTVVGGHIDQRDVIDEASLHSLDCIYLDSHDFYNGFALKFVTSERLQKTDSRWSSARDYYDEWSRGGTAVADLGDAAMWVDLPAGLLVLRGDTVLHLSADKADLTNAEVHARFEALARSVVSRLP